jgi:hypothetical protein
MPDVRFRSASIQKRDVIDSLLPKILCNCRNRQAARRQALAAMMNANLPWARVPRLASAYFR